jgi:hypothetical protein
MQATDDRKRQALSASFAKLRRPDSPSQLRGLLRPIAPDARFPLAA